MLTEEHFQPPSILWSNDILCWQDLHACGDLKKSMEGRLYSIEGSLSALQKEHHEAENHLDDMDEALSAADSRNTMLEATCKYLTAAYGLLKAKLNDLEGRSRRLNIRICGH